MYIMCILCVYYVYIMCILCVYYVYMECIWSVYGVRYFTTHVTAVESSDFKEKKRL